MSNANAFMKLGLGLSNTGLAQASAQTSVTNFKKLGLGLGSQPQTNNYVTKQTASSVKKLGELGSPIPEHKTTVLGWLLENLPRTGYGASNMLREFTDPSAGQTADKFDPLAAWMRGFKKEETTTGKDIMEGFGMSGDKAIFGGGDPHIYNPSAAGLAGLALDIFNPADPLNWVGFGAGGAVKSGGVKGATALEKAFGKGSADKIISLLGNGSIDDLAANSVGKIIKQITEKGKASGLDETGMTDLVDALKTGMSDAKTNPKSKLDYWQGKPLTVGLQNPLTLGAKGNFAELPIPGSEHLTAAVSKGINKFNQTKAGDTLGEMFQYGHVSKDAPQRLFIKDSSKVELDQFIRMAAKNKSKLPVSPEEIQALRNNLDSISISNLYNDKTASGGVNFDTLASITGAKSDTLMKLFDSDLPFTYSAGELYSRLKSSGITETEAFNQAFLLRGVMDRVIDLIPNQFRKEFKGTIMTPSVEFRYGENSPAGETNIYGPKSPYINYVFEYKGVGIALPINTSENFNKDMWAKLSEAMKTIDKLSTDTRAKIVKDIQIAPHDLGEYSDGVTSVKDPYAATFTTGKIALVDADKYGHSIPHEAGHVIWKGNPELADKYTKAADKDITDNNSSLGVSDYSFRHVAEGRGYEEDFAEAVARVINDPAGFIAEHPERAKVVQEALVDGSISPEEAKAIVERSDLRAKKISDAYGVENQLNSVVSRIDDATSSEFTGDAGQTVDNKQAMAEFTKDITRVLEKSITSAEDFKKVTKAIWKDVSEDEKRQIIRMAASFDESDPSFLAAISDKAKANQAAYQKAYRSTPEYLEKKRQKTQEYREKHKEEIETLRQTPEYKARKAEIDAKYRAAHLEEEKAYKSSREYKKRKNELNRERYQNDPVYREKVLLSNEEYRNSDRGKEVYQTWSETPQGIASIEASRRKSTNSKYQRRSTSNINRELVDNPDRWYREGEESLDDKYYEPGQNHGQYAEAYNNISKKEDGPSFYSKLDDKFNPTFHSVLRNVIDAKMANAMPVEDLKRMLKSNGVKDEEVQWTFLDDFFKGKQKISKADAQQWLDWNSLQVEEKVLGISTGGKPEWDEFKEIQVEEGWWPEEASNIENSDLDKVWERLGTFGEDDDELWSLVDTFEAKYGIDRDIQLDIVEAMKDAQRYGELPESPDTHYAQYVEPGGEDYKELLIKLPKDYQFPKQVSSNPNAVSTPPESSYQSPHFGVESDNLIAHTRFNTRYTPDGKKILFLEEIQSDWHQHGWREGYVKTGEKSPVAEKLNNDIRSMEEKVRTINQRINEIDKEIEDKVNQSVSDMGYQEAHQLVMNDPYYQGLNAEYQELMNKSDNLQGRLEDLYERLREAEGAGIADAPFKNTWRELVIKRMLKYASEEGFDGISWTSGAQQNKRWSQVEDVAAIYYSPVTKSLTTYKDDSWIKGEGPSVDKHLNEVEEKDLKKYLTQEQIARLTDPTPLELKVVAKPAWKSNISEEDVRDLNAVEMTRLIEKEGQDYMAYHIVDQYGNQFTYDYKTEAEAQKAINSYYASEQNGKVITTGDLQFGGGGFRTTYDERIPQDFEKLTKKFKLKTEDIPLGKETRPDILQWLEEDGDVTYEVGSDLLDEDSEASDIREVVISEIDFLQKEITKERGELAFSKSDITAIKEYLNNIIDSHVKYMDEEEGEKIGKRVINRAKKEVEKYTNELIVKAHDAISENDMVQKGVILTQESKDFFAGNTQPLFYAKTKKPDPELTSLDKAFNELSEPAQNAYREFIKWRESVVKEYQKREIPINVLEKYVPFVFIRKGNSDEMSALNAIFGTGSMPETDELSSLINWLSGSDPNLKTRTTKASDPTEVNKILDKPILSEDGGVIMATRGTRAIQAQELYDFADEFAGKYGMTIDEMADYKNIKGYKLYISKATADGRKIFEEVKAGNIMKGEVKAMFLPEEMVKMYNQYTDLIFGQQGMNKLLKTYDKATSLYKKLAYLWNPGHIMRDFTGNVFNGYMMGLTNPAIYAEAFNYMTAPDSLVKIPGVRMTAGEFMKKCRQNGILDIGSSLAEFSNDSVIGIKKAKNPVSAALNGYGYAMRMGTRQSDTFTRLAGMIYQMREGKSFDEASAQVKKYYFDYFELTSFERNVMKRIVPFYTWMRKNIPLQLEMLVKNPRELARISDTMNDAAGEDIDWGAQPEYIQQSAAFPMMNSDHYLSPNLPFTDLSRGVPSLDTLQNLLSAVSPLIRSPIELATNTQWFNGQPIENYAGEQRQIPMSGLLRNIGVDTPQINKRGAGYLGDQIPLLRNLDAITDMNNPRQMEKASSFIGGPGLYKKEAVQTSAQYEYLKRLQDLIKLLKDQQVQ